MNSPAARKRAPGSRKPLDWVWVLLLVSMFLEYVRPMDNSLSFLRVLRLGGIVTCVLALMFLVKNKAYLKEDRANSFIIAFWVLVAFTTLFAPNNRAAFNTAVTLFWLYAGFAFPINLALNSVQRVYKFFFWWIGIQTLLALFVITHGGHGPGSFLTDENDVGLAINMALPYVVYVAQFPDLSRRTKLLLYGAAVLFMVAIGVSASRGAVVGLAALIMMMIVLSRRPVRNALVSGGAILIVLVALVHLLPAAYIKDMQGIDDPNDRTRDERLWSWSIGWVMYKENPVFGVGASNYQWTNHLYAAKSPMYRSDRRILGGRVAHSLYFTLLPELGTAGLVIFAGLLKLLYDRCKKLRTWPDADPASAVDRAKFALIGKAMTVSLVAYLITGAFISVLYYPPFWHLVGMVIATYRVARLSFGAPGGLALAK
jgi:probable O-glycosylation ligase (exosortase A-associated)